MEQTPFYVAGGILVALALIITFVGLRFENFPASRGAMIAGLSLFALIVVGTATAAVINARDEQETRRAELAEEAGEESAEAEETGTEGPSGASQEEQEAAQEQQQEEEAAGGGETLEITSPADGGLSFDPTALEAPAGELTIDYTNPSAVSHNVALEDPSGETVSEGDFVTDGATSTAEAEVSAGDYIYYCAVTGHREAGMEGPLTVK